MNWTLKGRHGVVRRKLSQEGFKDCWGKTPRLAGEDSRGGLQGKIGKVSQGAFWKAPNPRLRS